MCSNMAFTPEVVASSPGSPSSGWAMAAWERSCEETQARVQQGGHLGKIRPVPAFNLPREDVSGGGRRWYQPGFLDPYCAHATGVNTQGTVLGHPAACPTPSEASPNGPRLHQLSGGVPYMINGSSRISLWAWEDLCWLPFPRGAIPALLSSHHRFWPLAGSLGRCPRGSSWQSCFRLVLAMPSSRRGHQ
jgi:hypothetical protein